MVAAENVVVDFCLLHFGHGALAHKHVVQTPSHIFLAGPAVRHGSLSFCFVYKFRQRFAIVADAIARGLGRDTTDSVQECRDMDMFLDDFECCKSACGDAC